MILSGLLCPSLVPHCKADFDILQLVQRRATKMTEGQEHTMIKDMLRDNTNFCVIFAAEDCEIYFIMK